MRFLSAKAMLDLLRDKEGESGTGDYRLLDGYDSLVNHLATDLDIHLEDPVVSVDYSQDTVSVQTLGGNLYRADNLVIAVPLGVLQANSIRFIPDLPKGKEAALKGLRMGPVIKMIYGFDKPLTDENIMALYSSKTPPMWWSPSFGQDTSETIWTAFVSGGYAVDLLAMGEEAALEAGLKTLAQELGFRSLQANKQKLVNWPHDPYTKGGYSYVLPGHDGAREMLAAATPPLYWAGEATEPEHRAATVHGAYLSGLRVAKEIVATHPLNEKATPHQREQFGC